MSSWKFGNYYRFTTVQAQHIIKTLPKGTMLVEVVCECIHGEKSGQRLTYKGYINNPENAARTLAEMRVMGYRGKKWGDWAGFGEGHRFEMRLMADKAQDGSGKVYPRIAFPRPMKRIDVTHASQQTDIDAVNESAVIGDFEQLSRIAEAQEHDRKNERAGVPFDDFDDAALPG